MHWLETLDLTLLADSHEDIWVMACFQCCHANFLGTLLRGLDVAVLVVALNPKYLCGHRCDHHGVDICFRSDMHAIASWPNNIILQSMCSGQYTNH